MKKTTKAVIIHKTTEVVSLSQLAGRVVSLMTENASVFPGTAADVAVLKSSQQLLSDFISNAKGNHVITTQRNDQAKRVHVQLQNLMNKVNLIAAGDVAIVLLSGFHKSMDPLPLPVPDKIIIRKVTPGQTALSAKIYIESLKQRRLFYIVRTTTVAGADVDDPSWRVVLRTGNSKGLIISGLARLEDVYISVNARNTAGEGIYSEPMSFSAR